MLMDCRNAAPSLGGLQSVAAYLAVFTGEVGSPPFLQATPLETFWPVVVIAIAIPEIYSVFTFRDPAKENQAGAQVRWETTCGRRLYSCRVKIV